MKSGTCRTIGVWAIKSVSGENCEETRRSPGLKRASVPRIGKYDRDRRNLLSGTDIDTQQTVSFEHDTDKRITVVSCRGRCRRKPGECVAIRVRCFERFYPKSHHRRRTRSQPTKHISAIRKWKSKTGCPGIGTWCF